VLVSRGSPDGQIALVDPTGIAFAEADAEVKVAQEGTVSLAEQPGGAEAQVSLWQGYLVATMAQIRTAWRVVRPGSVSVIEGAAYGN
jgi:hypothetical protein